MYCRYCGKKLSDNAVICTGCRRPVEPIAPSGAATGESASWSFLLMVALIFATLVLPPIGLIFGIIGLRSRSKKVQGAVLLTVATFALLLWLAVVLGL